MKALGLKSWSEPEQSVIGSYPGRSAMPGAKLAAKTEPCGQWGRAQRAGHGLGARNDILIRGGLLFDGTGAAGKRGDIAVRDGRIAAVGARIADTAAKGIDAPGLAGAAGFIDIKTHSDFTLPINPKAESKVRQGVTTEIVGHCGFSVAPALPGKVELLRDYLSASAPWLPFKATTFSDYLASFPATAVNA